MKDIQIGIAGCGGLGSNAAQNLVRLGFKRFLLVDFDFVELSNLNRQFYFYNQIGLLKCDALKENLCRIYMDLEIETIKIKVTKDNIINIFKDCDIVIEGFDKSKYKQILIEYLSPTKPCVAASGLGNSWNVDDIKTIQLNKNLWIVGDFKSDTDYGIPPRSPGVTISAAKEAAIVLKFALGEIK
ncbi:MAG: sulfur carrier protein ThiS adenylyltransferase ThiF [Spirochaetaceae bacterium]